MKGKNIVRRALRFFRSESGSFSVEASFVVPVVILVTVGILFFSLFVYQQAALTISAEQSTERAAFVWDNSNKDPETGEFPLGMNDGLYWRLSGTGLNAVFSLTGSTSRLPLPVGEAPERLSLPERKMRNSALSVLPSVIRGGMDYVNRIVERSVGADLSRPFRSPDGIRSLLRSNRTVGGARSYITEPVEFIRSVELASLYAGRLKQFFESGGTTADFVPTGESKPPVVIRSELQARLYIQETVGGRAVKFDTETAGEWREIDALDADGIAHEAKYTVNDKDAHEQILKDVELIRTGRIKGAVWHFFPLGGSGKPDLSGSLRAELERNGIVIVIHN